MEPKTKKPRRILPSSAGAIPLDVEKELEVLKKATEEVCASKESAHEYLVESGFLTPEGKLTEQYQ